MVAAQVCETPRMSVKFARWREVSPCTALSDGAGPVFAPGAAGNATWPSVAVERRRSPTAPLLMKVQAFHVIGPD